MRAVFLDRDGVINKNRSRIDSPEKIEIFPFAGEAIKKLNSKFPVVVVTNQPDVAKGFYTLNELERVHKHMKNELAKHGARIDSIYFCPHHPEKGFEGEVKELKVKCSCRKPEPGLLLKAAEEMDIDLEKSWIVGDSISDIVAGKRAGVKTILVTEEGGSGSQHEKMLEADPDFTCKTLVEAADLIVGSTLE